MTTITRRLEWDSGHRVLGHEGKCAHLHGHRYAAEITVMTSRLDEIGRVVDFGVVKTVIGAWIDQNWDHNFLCHHLDPLIIVGSLPLHHMTGGRVNAETLFAGKLPFTMPNGNPTAENIANVLFDKCRELLPKTLTVTNVRVFETPNCWADYSGDYSNGIQTVGVVVPPPLLKDPFEGCER